MRKIVANSRWLCFLVMLYDWYSVCTVQIFKREFSRWWFGNDYVCISECWLCYVVLLCGRTTMWHAEVMWLIPTIFLYFYVHSHFMMKYVSFCTFLKVWSLRFDYLFLLSSFKCGFYSEFKRVSDWSIFFREKFVWKRLRPLFSLENVSWFHFPFFSYNEAIIITSFISILTTI